MAGASVPHAAFAAFFQPAPPTPVPQYQPGEPISPLRKTCERVGKWTKRRCWIREAMSAKVRGKKGKKAPAIHSSTRYHGGSGESEVGPSYSAYELADYSWASDEPFLNVEPTRSVNNPSTPDRGGAMTPSPASPDLLALSGVNMSPFALLSRDPTRLWPTTFIQPRVHSSGPFVDMPVLFESDDSDDGSDDITTTSDSSEDYHRFLPSGTSKPEDKTTSAVRTLLRLVHPSPSRVSDGTPYLPAFDAAQTGAFSCGTKTHLDVAEAVPRGHMRRSPGTRNLSMCVPTSSGPLSGSNARLTHGVGLGVSVLNADVPQGVSSSSDSTTSDPRVFVVNLASDTDSSTTISSAMRGSGSSALSFLALVDSPPAVSPASPPSVSALHRLLSSHYVPDPAARAIPPRGTVARSDDAHVHTDGAVDNRIHDEGLEWSVLFEFDSEEDGHCYMAASSSRAASVRLQATGASRSLAARSTGADSRPSLCPTDSCMEY
ncbi:hypothetical protein CONPUDRAFT_144686 [Coniophora puteana RWD-64-598 SS2]|uniref:Uncharacterized protein n=1 Tax=Coniophora puteana (strain RWD-64-598) TaxID=741705 RepID=A0A5M3MPV0_CONPW|nr:uncharacterized protein CONPUDRAFT_144686 [Coniophora puteana RWD-64-598 SS2]EIW80734.1 hypothetical protein CONPUDRAFT_144686 [Coniophora puteana RWD-64-598 SS2]